MPRTCTFFNASAFVIAGTVMGVASSASHAENWNGQYIGAALGASKNLADVGITTQGTGNYFNATSDHAQIKSAGSRDFDPTDINGSLFWGINRQAGKIVYGVETDLNLTNFDAEHHSGQVEYLSAPGKYFSLNTSVVSYWNASLRPRLGYAQDGALFFASAGPAITQVQYNATFSDTAVNEYSHISSNKLKLGWSAGFGYERKIQDGWSLKTEFLYTNFNNLIRATTGLKNFADGLNHDVDYSIGNVRIAIVKSF